MQNPILAMLGGMGNPSGGNPANFPMARLSQFAQLMRGRNPEQMIQNFIRMNNVDENQYRQVAAQARQICDMFGLK